MANRTFVQKWRTIDGQEHDTEAAALRWEQHLRDVDRVAQVVAVIEERVRGHHFSGLTGDDALFPYGSYWDDERSRNQMMFLDELGELIVARWDELKLALDGPTSAHSE